MEPFMIPIVMFISIALVITAFFYFRYRGRAAFQDTLRQAIDKGQELSPEIIERLAGPRPGADVDLRRGMIALAIGAAFAVFGLVLGEEDAVRPMLGLAAFPGLVGVAYLLLWKFGDKTPRET